MICCVALHHHGLKLLRDQRMAKTAAAAVAVSALMPDSFGQVANGLDQLLRLDETWPGFRLMEIAERVDAQFQDLSLDATNHVSFLRRCKKALTAAHC